MLFYICNRTTNSLPFLNDFELLYMISENNEEAYSLMLEKYQPMITKYADYYLNTLQYISR